MKKGWEVKKLDDDLNFSDLKPFITGMTVPKLNQEKMRSIPIPIPPLPAQQRLLAILDEAFAAIAKAKNAEQFGVSLTQGKNY